MKSTEYEASPAWSLLHSLQTRLQGDLDIQDETDRLAVRRLQSAADLAELFRGAEPSLIDVGPLGEVQNALQQIENGLSQYLSDTEGNRAHLYTAADGPVSSLVANLLGRFPQPAYNEVTGGMRSTLTKYRNTVDEELAALHEEVVSLRAQLANARQETDETLAAHALTVEQFEARVAARDERFEQLNEMLQQNLAAQAQAFEDEVARRKSDFEEREDERDAKQKEALVAQADAAAAQRSEATHHAEEILATLKDYEQQAEEILGSTGRHARSGEYGKWAEHQGRTALLWTVLTVAIGAGTVIGLIWAMAAAQDDSLQFVAYKISVGLLAATVAGYTAKQASEHRVQERRYKRLALDVATVEPFLANLEGADEIRADFAKRVFNPAEDLETVQKDSDGSARFSIAEFVEILKAARG